MKTFFEFLEEQTRIYPDTPKVKQFGDDTKMKLLGKGIKPPEENPNRPVDTTGANSPFADPSVKSYTVSPDKPKVGTDDAVGKLLKQKGFDRSGKKLDARSVYHPDHEIAKRERGIISNNKISDKVPSELPKNLRDKPPERKDSVSLQRQMSGDKAPSSSSKDRLNMLRLKVDRQHAADDAKMNEPAKKSMQPKVGSLAVKQTGYPAAKKLSLAPAESQRASSGGSYKIQPGDNPTKIAQKLGLKSVKDLEAKNPGILKRAKRLKIGGTINR